MKFESVCKDCKIKHVKELSITQYDSCREIEGKFSLLCYPCQVTMIKKYMQDHPLPVKNSDETRFKNLLELGAFGIYMNKENQV